MVEPYIRWRDREPTGLTMARGGASMIKSNCLLCVPHHPSSVAKHTPVLASQCSMSAGLPLRHYIKTPGVDVRSLEPSRRP